MSGAFTTAPFHGAQGSARAGAPSRGAQPRRRHPLPSRPQSHREAPTAPTGQAAPRQGDGLAVHWGLSSGQTQGGRFHAHSNNNIPAVLSCSASLEMQSLQENFPPPVCDPLMETMKGSTRGQSKSCPINTLTLARSKRLKQSGASRGCSSDTLWQGVF